MYRRIIILTTILWSGILGIPSCVVPCDDIPPYWKITDIDIYLTDNNFNEYVSGIYESDTLRLGIEFSHEFLTQLFHPFINSTFATENMSSPWWWRPERSHFISDSHKRQGFRWFSTRRIFEYSFAWHSYINFNYWRTYNPLKFKHNTLFNWSLFY